MRNRSLKNAKSKEILRNVYMDCNALLNCLKNVNRALSGTICIKDSRARRSNSSEPTAWERRTALKIAAPQIKGPIKEDDWKATFSNSNIILTNKRNNQTISVPLYKIDEAENNENFDKYKGRIGRITRVSPFSLNSPIVVNGGSNEYPKRTLSQSFGDLATLLAILGSLTTALEAVKGGVFASGVKKAISKLKMSKKGIEEAKTELQKTI